MKAHPLVTCYSCVIPEGIKQRGKNAFCLHESPMKHVASPFCGIKPLGIGHVWKNTVQKEVDLNVLRLKFYFFKIYLFIYLFVFTHLIIIFIIILLIFDIFRYARAYVRTGSYAPD